MTAGYTSREGRGFWDSLNILASVTPIGRLGKAGGVLSKTFKLMRKGKRAGHGVRAATKHLFKILPASQAKKLTKGFNHKIEAHHILEARHAQRWGLNPDDLPAEILPQKLHQQVTKRLREMLPYGKRYEMDEVWSKYREVYTDLGFSEWLQAIDSYF